MYVHVHTYITILWIGGMYIIVFIRSMSTIVNCFLYFWFTKLLLMRDGMQFKFEAFIHWNYAISNAFLMLSTSKWIICYLWQHFCLFVSLPAFDVNLSFSQMKNRFSGPWQIWWWGNMENAFEIATTFLQCHYHNLSYSTHISSWMEQLVYSSP